MVNTTPGRLLWRVRRRVLTAFPRWLRAPPVLWPAFVALGLGDVIEVLFDPRFAEVRPIGAALSVSIAGYGIVLLLAWLKPPAGYAVDDLEKSRNE